MRSRPVVGITVGDPAGVGPEIVAKLRDAFDESTATLRLIGSAAPMRPGKPTLESAKRAWDALEDAAELAKHGEIDALVTGPVCKHSLRQIGFPYPGQTEFFAARADAASFGMVLTGGKLTVGLVTIHEPLAAVPGLLTGDLICRRAGLLLSFMNAAGSASPRIAIAGLNPHAGENGEMGCEETEIIEPAAARLENLHPGIFSGPFSPDTVFHRAVEGEFDAVLCMYHDQGLIPLKLHAFHTGVNVTVGLPFWRTSPDHGTAFGIAGSGQASPQSFNAAVKLAVRLAGGDTAKKRT
jgi:4-hydroxythreonine-4-phosphate dehydrogenase